MYYNQVETRVADQNLYLEEKEREICRKNDQIDCLITALGNQMPPPPRFLGEYLPLRVAGGSAHPPGQPAVIRKEYPPCEVSMMGSSETMGGNPPLTPLSATVPQHEDQVSSQEAPGELVSTHSGPRSLGACPMDSTSSGVETSPTPHTPSL